jgi:hypothetical protein
MDRTRTAIRRMTDNRNEVHVPGTPEERIQLVWPLTQEIVSLSEKYDAERRLQRHVTFLVRREC